MKSVCKFNIFSVLIPILLLFIITRVNYSYNPYPWPDEALFSSPAISLAEKGIFATPVLKGLIPGMDRVTLWNSPLFMLLLSGVYSITGESQIIARGVSFFLGCLAVMIFFLITGLVIKNKLRRFLLSVFLVCDLTFSRAANTVRMDMLTLVSILICLYFLLLGYHTESSGEEINEAGSKTNRKTEVYYFLAGIFTGITGLSHPIGIIIVPVVILFTFKSLRHFILAGIGGLISFSTWLIYIIPNWNIFLIQFQSQLIRKPQLLHLWGGETGGILIIFSSQYGGGGFPVMFGALLMLAIAFGFGLFHAFLIREKWKTHLYFIIFASFIIVTSLVMLATEAWYPVYISPFLLLLVGYLSESNEKAWWSIPLKFTGFFLIVSLCIFIYKHHFKYNTPNEVDRLEKRITETVKSCKSIYLRIHPDPYFLIRKYYPKKEVLQFIPGKLSFNLPNRKKKLFNRYRDIDCFLLDKNNSWEPILTSFLQENQKKIQKNSH